MKGLRVILLLTLCFLIACDDRRLLEILVENIVNSDDKNNRIEVKNIINGHLKKTVVNEEITDENIKEKKEEEKKEDKQEDKDEHKEVEPKEEESEETKETTEQQDTKELEDLPEDVKEAINHDKKPLKYLKYNDVDEKEVKGIIKKFKASQIVYIKSEKDLKITSLAMKKMLQEAIKLKDIESL